MRQKVSLKELVGTKIIYAGLIAFYYWTCVPYPRVQ